MNIENAAIMDKTWCSKFRQGLRKLCGTVTGHRNQREASGIDQKSNQVENHANSKKFEILCHTNSHDAEIRLKGFCDPLGWKILFASSAEARSAIAGDREFDAFVVHADAMDKSLFSTLAAFRRGGKANTDVPALLILTGVPQPDYLDRARLAFEHVEFEPILFSTFKLVVRRLSAGKHSAWPALPDTPQ